MPVFGWKRRWSLRAPATKGCCGKLQELGINKQLAKIYAATCLAMLASSFAITMVFPFLPFMVKFLLPDIDESSVGKYAGIIASSMFFGRFCGSYIWGALADWKGRKPVIIVSTILMGLTTAGFGFSVNFPMAVVLRFLLGLSNGVVGTLKAVMGEASDDRNQATGLSLLTACFSVGIIMGPAISGAIADPINQYNLTISNPALEGFLTKFPYSLPGLVELLLTVAAAIAVAILLPETLGMRKKKHLLAKDDEEEEEESEHSTSSEGDGENTTENTKLIQSQESSDDEGCDDVDLGTLGRKLFAVRDDNDTSKPPPPPPAITLQVIVEDDEPGTGDADASLLNAAPGIRREDSGVSLQLSVGVEMESSPSSLSSESYTSEQLVVSSDGQSDSRIPDHSSDLSVHVCEEESTIEEVDLGEFNFRKPLHSSNHKDTQRSKASASTKEKTRKQARTHRRDSILVPYFNRRNSITPSFVKVSFSALHRKLSKSSVDSSQEPSPSPDLLSQEEVEVPCERDTERLLGESEEVEVSGRRRWWRNGARSLKNSLLVLKSLLCDKVTLLAVITYCVFSFAIIGFDEIYSLWAATPPDLGGLGFTLHEIGISLAVVGAITLPSSIFLFPVLEKYFHSIMTFQMNATMVMLTFLLFPNLHFLVPSGQTGLLWFLLLLAMLVIRVAVTMCFSATTLIINNSVTADKLGAVNGLAMSCTSIFRTVSPVFSGGVFSVSLSEETQAIGFPLDYHLIFIVFAGVVLGAIIMVACLPKRVNHQIVTT